MSFNFDSVLSAAAAQATNEQQLANKAHNPVDAIIATMQGLDNFAKRGHTAMVDVHSASKLWLSKDLMKQYMPCSFHWQLPSDTARVSGVCIVGMPYSIDANGFQPAPKSEWDAAMAQGNGATSRLMSYYNKATKSWVEYPIVRPDFAGLGFLTEDGQVFEDQLVKHPYEPSLPKVEGSANWSVKLTRFNPGDIEGSDEWAELAESMASNIRKYAQVGDTRHFGYMLLVGYVTDVHLHMPSNAKKDSSDEYEYDQTNGHMLSVTMPIFGCYVRPLTWRLDTLSQIDRIAAYVHKGATHDPNAKAVQLVTQVLNKMPEMVDVNSLENNVPVVRVTTTTNAPVNKPATSNLPGGWKDLHIIRKLAICHKLSGNEVVRAIALEVMKGKDFSKVMSERGLKNSFLVQMIEGKNLLSYYSQFPLGKAEAYFKSATTSTQTALSSEEDDDHEYPEPDEDDNMYAAPDEEVILIKEVPAAPAAVVEPTPVKKSLIKTHSKAIALNDEEEEVPVKGSLIKPSGTAKVTTPEVKPVSKRSELDDYGMKTCAKPDLSSFEAEFTAPALAPTNNVDEVAAITYEELNIDDLLS